MNKPNKNISTSYLSPIIIHNGLLRGCAFITGECSIRVAAFINGEILTTFLSESPVPETYWEALAKPKNDCKGFLIPLPEKILDGIPHKIIIRLYKPKQKPAETIANDIKSHWLSESSIVFQHGDRHGHVALAGKYIQGWVAFNHRPNPLPQLTLSNELGNLCKQITLIPLPTESGHPDKFLAKFNVLLKDPPIPLHVHCGNIELSGSPLKPEQKLIGLLEDFCSSAISGWAFDANKPSNPVELTLKIDEQIIQHFRPNLFRHDIARHLNMPQKSLGIIGFQLAPPEILFDDKSHQISVEFTGKNKLLRGSGQPVKIPRTYLLFDEFAPPPEHPRSVKIVERPIKPEASIIVLNRDGVAPLSALLKSLKKQNSLTNIEIIVVDHASEDGSLNLLKYWQSQLPLHIIPLSFNDSFSASCNRAAAEARSQFLLFLNNDIVWLQNALPSMVCTLKTDSEVGAVGLKLLKSTDKNQQQALSQAPVQHLGVRFKLSDVSYWPYEATPDEAETEFCPQSVPVVTAAVMLCRKDDFLSAGQFDPDYFYGYEDVEFCLRLTNRLNKKIICRNDLVALHHHGHTRLSGRATDIFERVIKNADILQAHAGLWLKRSYWTSLINADNHFTTDKLTIGFVIDETLMNNEKTQLQTDAIKLAKQIIRCYPTAQVVFLPPSRGWYNLRDVHLLIVGHPEYDIERCQFRRGDLLTFAWIRERTKVWQQMPWWKNFDGYLGARPALIKQLAPTISSPITQITAALPLGSLFNIQSPPLRIALLILHQTTKYKTNFDRLQQSLKRAGAIVWQDPIDVANGSTRVADIRIAICLNKTIPKTELKPASHMLNIFWAPHIKIKHITEQLQGWQIINQMPQADWLQHQIEKALGNTFRSS